MAIENDTGEESEVEDIEESTEEEESTDDESAGESEEESTEEGKSDDSSSKDDLDIDAEIARENAAAGETAEEIAARAFKDRKNRREGATATEGEKPLTQKDLAAFEARIRKDATEERALEIAKGMAGSDKEAQLIVAKWRNRTFPKNLSLTDQMQEAYVITHSKKLVGERNEAMRALRGKQGVRTDAATGHRDASKGNGNEPKMPPRDAAAIRASGFAWNNSTRQYEKKLPNGNSLIRDTKTKQVRLVRAK